MTDEHDLEGKLALVTGSTSGIGRATAELMAHHGAEVIVQGRDSTRGQEVVESILSAGGKARFIAGDLSLPDHIGSLVDMAGPVDILVNNAGASWFGPTVDLDVAGLDRLLAANIRAPYLLVAALAPGWLRVEAAASSTSAVRPVRSACPEAPPMAEPKARWTR